MADSDNTTTLPSVSRRSLIAGAIALPAASSLAAMTAIAPATSSPFAILAPQLLALRAEQAQMLARWRAAYEPVEQARLAWIAAKEQADAISRQRIRRLWAGDDDPVRLARIAKIKEMMVSIWPEAEEANLNTHAQLMFNMFDDEGTARSVDADLDMVAASDAIASAQAALDTARADPVFRCIDDECEAISDRVFRMTHELEIAAVWSVSEFLQKLDLMSQLEDESAFNFVDFLDLAVISLAPLDEAAHQMSPETAALKRGALWWGPAPQPEGVEA